MAVGITASLLHITCFLILGHSYLTPIVSVVGLSVVLSSLAPVVYATMAILGTHHTRAIETVPLTNERSYSLPCCQSSAC